MHPEIFYKYAPASTALIVLGSSRIRWSSPFKFDDPAEFKRMPRFEPSLSEAAKTFPRAVVQAALGELPINEKELTPSSRTLLNLAQLILGRGVMTPTDLVSALGELPEAPDLRMKIALSEFFNEPFISTARVLCVTPAYDNEKLWIDYAESFTGCVLGFRHLPEIDTPLMAAKPVLYSEQPPIIGSGMDFLFYGGTKHFRDKTIDAVCFSKQRGWEYQNEWRTVTWRDNEGDSQYGDYAFYPDELESVTVGNETPSELINSIARLVNSQYRHCRLYKLLKINGTLQRTEID